MLRNNSIRVPIIYLMSGKTLRITFHQLQQHLSELADLFVVPGYALGRRSNRYNNTEAIFSAVTHCPVATSACPGKTDRWVVSLLIVK